jgi:hypothetical protein
MPFYSPNMPLAIRGHTTQKDTTPNILADRLQSTPEKTIKEEKQR